MSYGSSALLCTCRWAPRCQASPGLLELFSSCSSPGHPRDFKAGQRITDSCLNSQLTRNSQGSRDISLCPEQGSIDFCQILPVPRWGSHRKRTIHHRKLCDLPKGGFWGWRLLSPFSSHSFWKSCIEPQAHPGALDQQTKLSSPGAAQPVVHPIATDLAQNLGDWSYLTGEISSLRC